MRDYLLTLSVPQWLLIFAVLWFGLWWFFKPRNSGFHSKTVPRPKPTNQRQQPPVADLDENYHRLVRGLASTRFPNPEPQIDSAPKRSKAYQELLVALLHNADKAERLIQYEIQRVSGISREEAERLALHRLREDLRR